MKQNKLNPEIIHDIAAHVFWDLAALYGVAEVDDRLLQSDGQYIGHHPLCKKFAKEVYGYPSNMMDAISNAVSDEAFQASNNNQNMNGIIYTEDYSTGRAADMETINTSFLSSYSLPELKIDSPFKIETMGRLCLRYPLPAIVFSKKAPLHSLIKVEDTFTALGAKPCVFLLCENINKISDDLYVLSGIFYIPAPNLKTGDQWNHVMLNAVHIINGFTIRTPDGILSIHCKWDLCNRIEQRHKKSSTLLGKCKVGAFLHSIFSFKNDKDIH